MSTTKELARPLPQWHLREQQYEGSDDKFWELYTDHQTRLTRGAFLTRQAAEAKLIELNREERIKHAAPDLLAACQAALHGYERNFKQNGRWISCSIHDEAKQLQSAIAKATQS